MNLKKIGLSSVVVITFLAYSLNQRLSSNGVNNQIPPLQVGNSLMMPKSQSMMRAFKDGSYTGNVVDAFYGNVQVKAVIQNGKITDVQFLDYPHDRNTSVEINTQATPLLKSEAIAAQSAQVDGVSGATQTSRAFIESLQSALTQAI